ncbi:DNA adenine methylase [Ferruginibacter sp.]
MTSTSPLRYPGGKTRFTNFIEESIVASNEKANIFVEPFCGGAGASISLLESGVVDRIAINDLDPLVSSFWKVVFGKSCESRYHINWLINKIETTKITIKEWRLQKALVPKDIKEAAWKCLYLNRTSFNGILYKAGPIGGWGQTNRKLDVRFNKEKIILRINNLYELREQVDRVDSLNWKRFCSYYAKSKESYLYLDPPYYNKAEQLYGCLFDNSMHISLRDYLINVSVPWMLSYDDAPEIRKLYNKQKGIRGRVIDQTYSTHPVGGNSFVGRELFYSNRDLPALKREIEPHVGLTIVGNARKVLSISNEAIRIPTISFFELGS